MVIMIQAFFVVLLIWGSLQQPTVSRTPGSRLASGTAAYYIPSGPILPSSPVLPLSQGLWPLDSNGSLRISVYVSTDLPLYMRGAAYAAIAGWTRRAPFLTFTSANSADSAGLRVRLLPGCCNSTLGYQGSCCAFINLDPSIPSCTDLAVLRAFGVVLGLSPEILRPDRSDFITVFPNRSALTQRSELMLPTPSPLRRYGRYQFRSVMHAGAHEYSTGTCAGGDATATIITRPYGMPIGSSTSIDDDTVAALTAIYTHRNRAPTASAWDLAVVVGYASSSTVASAVLIPGVDLSDDGEAFWDMRPLLVKVRCEGLEGVRLSVTSLPHEVAVTVPPPLGGAAELQLFGTAAAMKEYLASPLRPTLSSPPPPSPALPPLRPASGTLVWEFHDLGASSSPLFAGSPPLVSALTVGVNVTAYFFEVLSERSCVSAVGEPLRMRITTTVDTGMESLFVRLNSDISCATNVSNEARVVNGVATVTARGPGIVYVCVMNKRGMVYLARQERADGTDSGVLPSGIYIVSPGFAVTSPVDAQSFESFVFRIFGIQPEGLCCWFAVTG